jgi:RND superfamily putative drug exporter
MGLAGALTVAATAAAALTLLPALLGLFGHRVGRRWTRVGRRWTRVGRRPTGGGGAVGGAVGGRWGRWATHLDRHRLGYAVGATAVLLAIAAPVLALRLGTPDDGNQPTDWPQRRAYDRVAVAFGPGWNGPLVVAMTAPGDGATERLATALARDPEVAVVSPPRRSADGAVALLTVVPRHAPQDAQVADLVHRIRADLPPGAAVGGTAAFMIDLADSVAERLPWVVVGVILAAALLLLAMFRAPLVALKAAVMAVLSVGAAYGVIVAVFQWGWGLSLLGVDRPVPIMSVVPMLLFAVLFGLSMDYEVFLLASIREAYDAGGDPRRSVAAGLAATGGVITAAATIMAVVFLSFVMIDDVLVKMIGVGLAVAVVVDATVIRTVLAPAVMSLLGHRAWLPGGRRSTPDAGDRGIQREPAPPVGAGSPG